MAVLDVTGWPVWLLALIDVLAVHRLTRLVTADVITAPVRWAIIRWSYEGSRHRNGWPVDTGNADQMVEADMSEYPADVPRVAALIVCRWCASVYIAAGAVAAHTLAPGWWLPCAGALALSSASTMLAALEE